MWMLLGHSLRENLQVLFLSETNASEETMERVMKAIGFAENIVLGSAGRSGGIWMMWKNDFKVDVTDFNKNVAVVKIKDGAWQQALVGFYGLPYSTKRRNAWENLGAILLVALVCRGEFNLVIDDQEKDRGRRARTSAPNLFSQGTDVWPVGQR